MGTYSQALAEKALHLPEGVARTVLDYARDIEQGRRCEHGYTHEPNQETIDALNSTDHEAVTIEELRALMR